MATARSDLATRDEFLAVVLADPELLEMAFAEVIASWEAEPPQPPVRTLVATAERRTPRSSTWAPHRGLEFRHARLQAIPRPRVARSPPERSEAGPRTRRRGDQIRVVH